MTGIGFPILGSGALRAPTYNASLVNFFTSTSTFTPTETGTYIVIAMGGGAGGGRWYAGGAGERAGAGGSGYVAAGRVELTASKAYPVDVGTGGPGSTTVNVGGSDGQSSGIPLLAALGGRGSNGGVNNNNGGLGGSGGGEGFKGWVDDAAGVGGVDGADGTQGGAEGTPGSGQGAGAFTSAIALINGLDTYMQPQEAPASPDTSGTGGYGIKVDWSGSGSSWTEYGSGGASGETVGVSGLDGFVLVYGPI